MMRVALLAALMPLVLCTSLSVDRCSEGQAFWCTSLKNAKECGAFEHCKSTVWKNEKLTVDLNDNCQFCESIVKDVLDFLKNQATQDEIVKLLDAACSVLPSQEVAAECKSIVDQYFEEIINMIEMEMDPATVCSLMGLCNGFEKMTEVEPVLPAGAVPVPFLLSGRPVSSSGDVCVDCKTLLNDLKSQITDKATQQEIEDLLKSQVCANLGSLEGECNTLVETYIPELLELLASEVDADIVCQALGLCAGDKTYLLRMRLRKTPLYKAALNVQDDTLCIACEAAIGELSTLIKNPDEQKMIEDFIKTNLCSKLGSLADECISTVDQYGPIIFEFLAAELDPSTFCQTIGLCTGSNLNSVTRQNTLMAKAPKQETKPVKQSSQCVLCEFVVKELDQMLEKNATEQEIIAALEKVCSVLPDTIKDQCDDFVVTYGPVVIQLLLSELDPQAICTAVGLCSTGYESKVESAELCGVCETVFQYVDSLLEENATVTEIEQVLEKVCNFVPKDFKQECDGLIKQYGPIIIDLLVKKADPETICTAIKLCPGKTQKNTVLMQTLIPAKKATLVGTKECTYGPAFWCATKENAKRCNAEAHCMKHVWN